MLEGGRIEKAHRLPRLGVLLDASTVTDVVGLRMQEDKKYDAAGRRTAPT